jgi:transcriptional regulator with XRE-family HTH domain
VDEKSIGQNIRSLREASGVSLTEVARQAGLAKGTLSKIEKGQISSPIGTLMSVANVLGTRLADFFQEGEEAVTHILTRKGQGISLVRDGSQYGYSYEALALEFPGKVAEPFILTVRPEDKGGTFQHGGDEFIHVLSGQGEFQLGETKMQLKTGDSIYFNPELPHALRPTNGKPVRFLCLFIERSRSSRKSNLLSGESRT